MPAIPINGISDTIQRALPLLTARQPTMTIGITTSINASLSDQKNALNVVNATKIYNITRWLLSLSGSNA
ncbi:hypothetical protein GCM10023333_04930 [Ferrimonas pelagia]|uniref:Uncharacterized protein n=1 Tax=Ferrimonas pelagia TaxID=1177826 RepID=A0ABP9EHD6_9GAMM